MPTHNPPDTQLAEPVAVDTYRTAKYAVEWYITPPEPDAWFIVTRGSFRAGEWPETIRRVLDWTAAEPAAYRAIQRILSLDDQRKLKDEGET